ncbi:MAG: ABC transporter substrate-binding protein [Alistipes sp.]
MKYFTRFILLFLALSFSGCGGATQLSMADFTVAKYAPRYAEGFEIVGTKKGASTLLKVHNPWQGAGDVEQLLFMARDGEQPPVGFTGQVVKVPIHHAVCMSSSHVAMFQSIDRIRCVSGVSGIDYISNAYVNAHRTCGEVRDVGYDTNLNFELLVTTQPYIILLYGVSGENTVITGKLAELGIPYIYIGDYVEESPLGKAEWLMTVAELTDSRVEGKAVFDGICTRYNALCESVHRTIRPKVMLNTPYRDTWFMPSTKSYMVRLIEDAGGEYIYKENTSSTSVPIDLEQAYLLTHAADCWINVGALNTLDELKAQNPKFAEAPVVRAGRVYNNNHRQTPAGGSDFWESGVVAPDRVLDDLIHIFNRDSTELYYYKQLK